MNLLHYISLKAKLVNAVENNKSSVLLRPQDYQVIKDILEIVDFIAEDQYSPEISEYPKRFIAFLMANDVYFDFINALVGKPLKKYLEQTYPRNYIQYAFEWKDSPYGYNFWNELHHEWRASLKTTF